MVCGTSGLLAISQSSQSRPSHQRARRALLAALVVLASGCLWAPAALGQTPDFTWDPQSPVACEPVTFNPSDVPTGNTVTWDYDTGGFVLDPDLANVFTTEGAHPVTMRVDDGTNPPTDVAHTVDVGNAPPVAAFAYSPTQPDPDEWVVFTSTSTDCDDSVASVAWDFDDDGITDSTDATAAHKFSTPGTHDVTLTVIDQDTATDSVTHAVDVRDPSAPTAAFHRTPALSVVLQTGQSATFTSDSTAMPNSTLSWEIDGVAAGSGTSVTRSFSTAGNHVVRLTVSQTNGASDVAESTFRVNAPPVPGFVWAPGSPVAGNEVQLYSTSVDAEGALAGQDQAWDLDDDGQFDDATGPAATATFTAGDHDISLRVTDSDDVSRTITRTITVAAPVVIPLGPAPAPPSTPTIATTPTTPAAPALMKPFPIVRLVGVLTANGARITLVEVRNGPVGARVTVRCIGDGCPFKSRRRILENGRVRLSKIGALPAGTRLQVLVRAPGVIGRFVGFRIRKGKRPLRADRCLMPGSSQPTRCT